MRYEDRVYCYSIEQICILLASNIPYSRIPQRSSTIAVNTFPAHLCRGCPEIRLGYLIGTQL